MRRITLFAGVRAEKTPRTRFVRPTLEILEDRISPTVNPTGGLADAVVEPTALLAPAGTTSPAGGPGQPAGFSPAQISQAYGFNQISFNNGTVPGNGAGQTIAIVDAYSQPNIGGDLAAFDETYGLPSPPSFTVVNQNGGTALPPADPNWGLEESLDVEWAHAMAPQANIVLVEANSNYFSDLLTAVNYARNLPGVSAVSMSWGGGEWGGDSGNDSYFTTPAGHVGVTFVASSGDSGSAGGPEYPSVSPNVLAVGGTQLNTDVAGDYLGETGWGGSSGGVSAGEPQPGYQRGVVTQTGTQRAVPDVAYNGSSNSPYAVYDTSSYNGWIQVYGTSAGAPQWAALVAIADQGRALEGKGTLDGGTQTLPAVYQLPGSDFHDITSGSNGAYSAGPGYDLVTGRGSPLANLVVAGLVAAGNPSTNPPPSVVTPASASANPVAGTTVGLSARGADSAGAARLTYTWSVVHTPPGAPAPTFSVNGTNAAQNTTATFYQAGTYTFQVTLIDPSGLAATSDVTVTVNQTLTSVAVTPGAAGVANGGSLQFTATARDQFGNPMSVQPAWTWTLAGAGALAGNGVYTAPSAGAGTAVVQAAGDGMASSASVSFAPAAPAPADPPAASAPANPWAAWMNLVDQLMSELVFFEELWQSLFVS